MMRPIPWPSGAAEILEAQPPASCRIAAFGNTIPAMGASGTQSGAAQVVKRASCGRGWGDLTSMAVALGLSLLASAASASDRSTCKFFSQLPDDCAAAEQRKYDNLRGYRFEQIDLYAQRRDQEASLRQHLQHDRPERRRRHAQLGAPVLRRTYGPEEDRQAVPGDGGADQSAALLGARLVRRPRRRGAQLRRPGRGLDGQWPGRRGAALGASRRPRPIARRPSRARRSKASRRGRRSICSTTPRGAPGCSPPTRPPPCRAEASTISIRSATN